MERENQLLIIIGYPSRVNQFLGVTKKNPPAIRFIASTICDKKSFRYSIKKKDEVVRADFILI